MSAFFIQDVTLLIMRSEVMLEVIISFLLGVAVRTLYQVPLSGVVWLLLVGLVIGVWWRRKSFAFSAPVVLLLSLSFIFLAIGIMRTEIASWRFDVSPLEEFVGEKMTLEGFVVSEPIYSERSAQVYIETDTDKILVSTERLTSLQYGDKVTVSGKLERPTTFTTDLGRTFDYPNYLRVRGVEYCISFAQIEVNSSGNGNLVMTSLLQLKQAFIDSIRQVIPEPAVGLGAGLLLGVKSALGDEIEGDFRDTGIIHIVVLSGYNVMLVVAFIMYCLSFFLPLRTRIIFGILAIGAFAGIVGFSATVVRASVMAVLVLVAQVLGRRYDVLRALLLAGVVMVFINPYLLLYDIGFQLSFMATLGLILLIPTFESFLLVGKGVFGWREFFLSTVATQIAVLPLLMYHIGQVSIISLVVNMLVLPIVPLAMLLTFITGLLGFLSTTLANLVGYLATLSLKYILLVAHLFAQVPYSTVPVPTFSASGMILLYVLMALGWYWWQKRKTQVDELLKWTVEEGLIEIKISDAAGAELRSNSAPKTDHNLPIFFR